MTQKKRAKKKDVADMNEITKFWSGILRDEESDLKDRLKVSELLSKVQGSSFECERDNFDEKLEEMSVAEKMALIERIKDGEV